MASFRRGREAAAAAATRSGGGKFTPTHRFEAGETKYLQFLTSWDEIPTVLMHRFITVGFREDGNAIFRDFISRRDPGLDGPDGYDALIDRFESQPSQRCIGLAVELKPIYGKNGTRKVLESFEVVTREYTDSEGAEHVVPNVALVIESPYTFYSHLGVVDDITPIQESVLAVTRTGKSTDTTYTIVPIGDALSDEELAGLGVDEFFEEFDFEEYLEELADEDRMHELIDGLPSDFVVNKYAKRGKGKGNAKAEQSDKGRSTRARRVKDEEPEAPEAGETEGDGEAEEATPTRARRFSQLRKEVGASA